MFAHRLLQGILGQAVLIVFAAGAAAQGQPDPSRFGVEASIEGVYATRGDSGSFPIIQDTITTAPVLTTDSFSDDWAPGVDARLAGRVGNFGISGRFFGAFDWETSAATITPAIWNLPTNPPLFGLGVAAIDAENDSSLNTAELNLFYDLSSNATILAGARGMQFDDNLAINANFGANQATISLSADTFGIGPQLGLLLHGNAPGPFSRVTLDGEARGGFLFTDSNLDFNVVQSIGPSFPASGNPQGGTFFFEASGAVGLQMTDMVRVRGGYRVFYVDDLPTTGSSVAATNLVAPTIGSSSDHLLVHGATFGVDVRF